MGNKMQFKSFVEALKGKQHKIDKNKNGQIDAQDFKMLRKEDTEPTDESYDFNRAAIAKQRLQNVRHSGRKVRGASVANLMRAAGIREEEMDEQDLDQLDEVLGADAKASDWISDFVHSTNPKFEGKTKKERIKMALGAYYNTQKNKDGVSEAVSNTGPVKVKVQVAGDEPHEEKWENAKKKTVKEEFDEDGNITYGKVTFTDFVESLMEGRAQYMVKATHKDTGRVKVTTYVADKDESEHSVRSRAEREHKPSGYQVDSIRRKDIEAHGEGDEEETSSTTQKRGRGRPAGSKSGARGPRIK
jgi:hypothetical protein